MDKDIMFVAQHYRRGLFKTSQALRRVKGTDAVWWTRSRIAAAAVVAVIFTATAALIIHNSYFVETDSQATYRQDIVQPEADIVRAIDFEGAPLTAVVDRIREVYGVEVVNLPENADELHLSLHYEGSAAELIETINDILDTDMKIAE